MKALTPADAPLLSSLHALCFPRPWSEQEFTELLNRTASGWRIEAKSFILIQHAADEAEILTLATHPNNRGKGYAQKLLHHTIAELQATAQIRQLFLEVAATNHAAIRLYQKTDFTQIARRASYYQHGGKPVDALIFRKAWGSCNNKT